MPFWACSCWTAVAAVRVDPHHILLIGLQQSRKWVLPPLCCQPPLKLAGSCTPAHVKGGPLQAVRCCAHASTASCTAGMWQWRLSLTSLSRTVCRCHMIIAGWLALSWMAQHGRQQRQAGWQASHLVCCLCIFPFSTSSTGDLSNTLFQAGVLVACGNCWCSVVFLCRSVAAGF